MPDSVPVFVSDPIHIGSMLCCHRSIVGEQQTSSTSCSLPFHQVRHPSDKTMTVLFLPKPKNTTTLLYDKITAFV